jgi:hypothetical protein
MNLEVNLSISLIGIPLMIFIVIIAIVIVAIFVTINRHNQKKELESNRTDLPGGGTISNVYINTTSGPGGNVNYSDSEKALLAYLKEHNYQINLTQASNTLGIQQDQLKNLMEGLAHRGIIRIS